MAGRIGGWYDSSEFASIARNGMADFAGAAGVCPEAPLHDGNGDFDGNHDYGDGHGLDKHRHDKLSRQHEHQ